MYDFVKQTVLCLLSLTGALLEPTLPMAGVLFFAILFDCFSAFRLSQRLRRRYPDRCTGKFRSEYALKLLKTFITMYGLILLLFLTDRYVMPEGVTLNLASWATLFCVGVQLWSILENVSSANGYAWAKVLQKVMVDKSQRHFDIKLDNLKDGEE
jgi:hypothetical protein